MPDTRQIISWGKAGTVLTALALAIGPCLLAQSQTPQTPKWSVVTFTTIKPDMRAEFEAWQKELTAAYKKADVPSRAVVQTLLGDLFEYISISPISRFGDLDGPSPVERALGKEDSAKLMQKGRSLITSAHRITSASLDDLSIRTPTSEPAPYALVIIAQLAQQKNSEFESWAKDQYLPVLKKAEVKNFWISRTVFGGDPDERVMVMPLGTMAEIDKGPPATRVLGREGAQKLMAGTAAFTKSVQYRMVRYRADLSYDMMADRAKTSASAK
jgi:hypothetical protein